MCISKIIPEFEQKHYRIDRSTRVTSHVSRQEVVIQDFLIPILSGAFLCIYYCVRTFKFTLQIYGNWRRKLRRKFDLLFSSAIVSVLSNLRFKFTVYVIMAQMDIFRWKAKNGKTNKKMYPETISGDGLWEQRFNELVQFRGQYGHCKVPISYQPNQPLAQWVHTQRKHCNNINNGKCSFLIQERIK